MDFKLELVLVPVTDVDRTKAFYLEHLGFDLLVDTPVGEMRIVQVTPPGSACSIGFGTGLMDGTQPGTYRGMHLVVADIVAARASNTWWWLAGSASLLAITIAARSDRAFRPGSS